MKQIKIGIVGLGRLGMVHAMSLANQTRGAVLQAATSSSAQKLEHVRQTLGVADLYTNYDDMLNNADIDAVAIVTSSGLHCEQIEKALKAKKHVFCEKPLGISIAECQAAEQSISKYPGLVFLLGFMRRFDPSYLYAKQKIHEGAIGTPYLIKCCSMDPMAVVEFYLQDQTGNLGNVFIDLGVHDIDLMRWLLNEDPTGVFALGGSYKYPQFEKAGDAEAGIATFTFASGNMATMHVGRAAAHGYHVETEIVGTEGSIRIGGVPHKNLAMLYGKSGVLAECHENFPERFEQAYRNELQAFTNCVLLGQQPDVTATDGRKAVQIAQTTAQSFKRREYLQIKY